MTEPKPVRRKDSRTGKPREVIGCPRCPFRTNDASRLLEHIERRHEPKVLPR